jgi:hypothetical protein
VYRDGLAELFARYPFARVRTAMAYYKGEEGFLSTYPATAYVNVGSMMNPAYMPDLCDCSDLRELADPTDTLTVHRGNDYYADNSSGLDYSVSGDAYRSHGAGPLPL